MRPHALAAAAAALVALVLPAVGAGHELDHPAPSDALDAPLASGANSGGPGADWDLVTTLATGNPHSDLDFFTRGGETYAAVGTLAIGANGGGQSIFRLTEGGEVDSEFVSAHPSATCVSNPAAVLSLQHDVEATPKGGALLNAPNRFADRRDAQLLIDATDAEGRCHDQGTLGFQNAPSGGLEIVDITDPRNPVEIGLTSHIGEAHTVNVDPKRPHIAYAVTSDGIGVKGDGRRENEDPNDSDRFDLDGFEVVDLSSCMNFPPGTTVTQKRAACRPQVFRYRYESAQVGLGHTLKTSQNALYGCHELEVYANDLLTCGGGNSAIVLDMSKAFDDRGTRNDYSDDRPVGTPLPCQVRDSSSRPPFGSGAKVTDCVDGQNGADLTVPGWIRLGSPSLEGVRWLGSVHHQGRGAGGSATPAYDSTQDVDFNHETELTQSGNFLLATDERGGGVAPPGASCMPGVDNKAGNGGVHAYRTDLLSKDFPATAAEAHRPYARQPDGSKAIYRAKVRTKAEPTACTAHVFQQIPGQNRIFMGWYSQGTQVVDFVERRDGTLEFREAGWFIPEHANTWTSHVFKHERNADGSYTYWGATGDFALGTVGRNAVDIWKVKLPPPPRPLPGPPIETRLR